MNEEMQIEVEKLKEEFSDINDSNYGIMIEIVYMRGYLKGSESILKELKK